MPGRTPLREPSRTPARRALNFGPSSSKRRKIYVDPTMKRAGKVGEDPGMSNCKRQTTNDVATISPGTPGTNLDIYSLTDLTKGSDINNRERDLINCRGFRIRYHFSVLGLNPVHVHLAVVAPKQTWDLSGQAAASSQFLRGNGATRFLNFGSANSGLVNNHNGINTDRFTVLSHKRVPLGLAGSTSNYMGGTTPNWSSGDYYVKVNRQLRYESGGTTCDTPVYLVVWFDSDARQKTVTWTTFDSTAALQNTIDTITYFKEPV